MRRYPKQQLQALSHQLTELQAFEAALKQERRALDVQHQVVAR